MYIKNIIVYVYIILCFQYINTFNITINSENNKYVHKGPDILKTQIDYRTVENYERHYYCKDNNCIELPSYDDTYFIEFAENNETKRYIQNTCIYDNKLNKVINCENYVELFRSNQTEYLDLTCTKNSECFYNKCIDNYCVFSEDSDSTHCDFVHKGFAMFQFTYLHCGKAYFDICKYNAECSSNRCHDKRCSYNYYIPSDSSSIRQKIETVGFWLTIIALFTFCFFCYICLSKPNRNQQFSKLNNNTNN